MKRRFSILIILMITTVAGLITVLSLMFSQNFKNQQIELNQSVQSALNDASEVLDQNDKLMVLKTSNIFDSIIQNSDVTEDVIVQRSVIVDSMSSFNSRMESRIEIKLDTVFNRNEEITVQVFNEDSAGEDYSGLIQEILHEAKQFSNGGKEFNSDSIQAIIKESLTRRGVNGEFEFSVYDNNLNKLLIGNEKLNEFSQTLYPKSVMYGGQYELGLNLINKNQLIWKKIQWSLFLVVLLAIAILFCFIYALLIINKQKKMDQMKTDFINNMTHEFKTPLASISLASESVLHQEVIENPEKIENFIGVIQSEKQKMMEHIEHVLEIATLDKDEAQFNFETVNLNAILVQLAQQIQPKLNSVKGEIHLNLTQEVNVSLDKYHFTNALSNILENCIKYRSDKNLKIELDLTQNQGNAIVLIKDNGIGIFKDSIDRVFEKFYREERGDVHNVKGFGLGLSYAKKIVEAHQGEISINSTKNIGTEVKIRLNNE